MKIKEAAQRTGLTEKAIRFYEQKHLITPRTYELNGRTFREYTEENIRDLTNIAVLRRAFFTVEQIRTILCEKDKTPEVFREYRQSLCADYAQMTPLIQRIAEAEEENLFGIEDVAALLTDGETEESRPSPRELRLSPSDESSADEREEAYRTFLHHQAMRDRRDAVLSFGAKILRFCGILLGILLAMYVLWFALDNFRIIRKVNVTLEGVEWQEGRPETAIPRTITFSGEICDYLFRTDFGNLTMEISGYSEAYDGLYRLPKVHAAGNIGSNEAWTWSVFDTIQRDADREIVLLDRVWYNHKAQFGVVYLNESTGAGSFTYDPDSEKSRLLAIGITDAEKAQIVFEYAKIEERRLHDLHMKQLRQSEE